jgi:hypothetical protein
MTRGEDRGNARRNNGNTRNAVFALFAAPSGPQDGDCPKHPAMRPLTTATTAGLRGERGASRTAMVNVSGDGWPTGPAPLECYQTAALRSAFGPFRSWGDFRRATDL